MLMNDEVSINIIFTVEKKIKKIIMCNGDIQSVDGKFW